MNGVSGHEATRWSPRRLLGRVRAAASRRRRHRALASLRATVRRAAWAFRAGRLSRSGVGEPALVGIALVDHMGDLVAAEPIARHVRERHPRSRIVWIVREEYRELPESYASVDEVWTVSCLTEWIRLRERHPFDELVDLHVRGRSCGICRVRLERADGDPELDIGNYYRHGDLQEIFCLAAGLRPLRAPPRLTLPSAVESALDRLTLPDRYVTVHARSAQPVRDWRDEAWRELVCRLTETGTNVVEVGLEPVASVGIDRCVNLCGRLSILETAEVIRRSSLFVGIDSGPAHLANAVGSAAVLLMGTYRSYDRYRPWDPGFEESGRAEVLWSDGPAAELSVDRVFAAVTARLAAASA